MYPLYIQTKENQYFRCIIKYDMSPKNKIDIRESILKIFKLSKIKRVLYRLGFEFTIIN
jgi:hypothetical protein